ncbi:MAG TPA: hypothetical protein VEX64_03310, partial [Pyrinomonadaceae bacterium]|nr:hypothetical protein [Pyrinomonadaceae bacterium]
MAQTPQAAVKPTVLPGEVTAINTAANQISLKTKEGGIIVLLNDKTVYKRVSPDAPTDLKQATASSLSEIGVGDGIVAIGIVADDKKTIASRGVYLMTKSDIAKKQQTEREKWQTRGISGKVTAINPATNEITVSVRGGAMGGDRNVVVAASDKTKFRRYAQGSVKFSDAVAGNFADVKVGDQLRALGEKTTDGAKLTAEEVV